MHDDYMNTEETAKFLGVTKQTVIYWRKKGVFLPDIIGHGKNGRDGVYYYSKKHILQFSSVYGKNENGKKNYASKGVEESIITNNAITNSTTITNERQTHIAEAIKLFNLLYGKITTQHFAYLWTKQRGIFSFNISDLTQRENMAHKAVELSDSGVDVWHSVNPVNVEPTNGKRGDETVVSFQIACVVDIDIRSKAHKGDPSKLAADFDEAKSFLPFTPSLIIHSGYGLHAYYIFNTPIEITDDNRETLKHRNNLLLDIIRLKSNGKKIDGVGDLPRVMRTPGTFNYKLDAENPPRCHIVEDSALRFTPDELDAKLGAIILAETKKAQAATTTTTKSAQTFNEDFSDDRDFNIFRIRRMLDFISPSSLTYDEWLAVGMALKNSGCDCNDWENWSRADERFKDGECEHKWNGFNRDGYDIGTMYHFAAPNGYDAQNIYREWLDLHPQQKISTEKSTDDNSNSKMASLKAKLLEVNKALADSDTEKDKALENLRTVTVFDSDTVFADDIVTAGAFARLFDKQAYSNFKREIKLFGDKHRDKKATVNDWVAVVRDKADLISSRRSELATQRNEILAQIKSLSFVADDDTLAGILFPPEYSISADGIEKIAGESMTTICRRPVIISSKSFDVEEKNYKLTLAYMTTAGKWKKLPATEAASIFDKNKLIVLSNKGLPVTSVNALNLVDYLDAFHALNENNLPLTYTVPRCGWYTFNGSHFFIDPRKHFSVADEGENFNVVVDSQSQFAKTLCQVGSLDAWKKAYQLAKKSPVARIIVAAAVAPILLKILGERNFLLYIVAPTRAGKTTALYLGASAVGSEKMIRSFDATKNGLAGAAADVSDYAFLIDEKQVADNRLKEQFDNLVYALANGIGRTKLSKDSTLKKLQDWRTIAIMTGETLLLSDNVTGGANTRLLSIKVSKEILSAADCKAIRDIIKKNCGLAFPLVVNKVFEIGFDNLRKWYKDIVDAFTATYPELLPDYCRYIAILTLADGLLNSVLGTNNALADAKVCAKEIFKLIPTVAEISDVAREKEFVRGFVAQNQSRFVGGNVELDRMQAFFGKLDEPDYIYITAKALQDACNADKFDYKKLVDDSIADGFFIPSDKIKKGRKTPPATVQKKIGKVNVECYRIPRTAFDDDK
jgi:uncharacterized protein (DUF927 family)